MNERKLPSYPLFVKDPNYSLWSAGDVLNESPVQVWWGEEKKLYGFVKSKGEAYCFLGNSKNLVAPVSLAKQLDVQVTTFATEYTFAIGESTLKVRFTSPLPLNDLELLSLPVCYMSYEVEGDQDAEVALFVNRNVAYNEAFPNTDKTVRCGIVPMNGFEDVTFGLMRQLPLSNTADLIGADWGYWHLTGEKVAIADEKEMLAYCLGKSVQFEGVGEDKYLVSLNHGGKGRVLLGFDEVISIDYFGDYRKGYYLEDHTVFHGLEYVYHNHDKIEAQLSAFEADVKARAARFGEGYLAILNASYRQSIAAHKLIKDKDGNIHFLSKENGSNGCIGTVDVSYPSMPLYLIYNPELVKGMMRCILNFARMPVWKYDFAPHDVGTYPACCGQVYSIVQTPDRSDDLNKWHWRSLVTHFPMYTLPTSYNLFMVEKQMPVEECANMLVMFLATYRQDGDIEFFKSNLDLCEKWVKYLVQFGLKPDNQLCTDDFAGHLKNNVNLAIKAIVGIKAFAELLDAAGKDGKQFHEIAKQYAAEITAFANKYDHLPITWDTDDSTFSLKYNFAFDKLLGLNLFPQELFEKETDCYLNKLNKYGTPLDNRADYTKSDWICWSATLTDDEQKRRKMIDPLVNFLTESPDRIPFGDWYETADGKYYHFRARSVQGGCFILLLLK